MSKIKNKMKQENPNMVYGRLAESVHISGYSLERAMREFEYLLEDNRWQSVGKGYKDINEFIRSLSFAEFKIAVEQRKKIANKLKELEASQRATADMLGVSEKTIRNDADKSAPKEKIISDYQDVTNVDAELSAPKPEEKLTAKPDADVESLAESEEDSQLFSKSGKELLSIAEQKEKKAHVSHNSGENEWYTPSYLIESARRVMGTIDLDPATTDFVNKTVMATEIFTVSDNGLEQAWHGNVWIDRSLGR